MEHGARLGCMKPQHAATTRKAQALLVCFFLLGLGLLAPMSAMLQCMDYLNARYLALHAAKVLPTCYNGAYLLAGLALFCSGSRVWPSKRGRMLAGYVAFMVVLLLPPMLDLIMANFAPPGVAWDARGGIAVTAVCTACAGAAEALISSVAYGEAAALSLRYTHAFMAGKAVSGLGLALMRCLTKLLITAEGGSLAALAKGAGAFVLAAAAFVLLCAAIVAFALPHLDPLMQQLRAHAGLSVQQTLQQLEAHGGKEGSRGALQGRRRSPSLLPERALALDAQAANCGSLGGGLHAACCSAGCAGRHERPTAAAAPAAAAAAAAAAPGALPMQLLGRLPWWRRGQSSELARADAVCELIDAEDACSCQASDGLPDAADCSTADVESGGSGGSSSSSSASSSASLGNGDGDCCCLRDSGRDHHGRRPGDASNAACCSDAASVASSPASQGSTSSSSGGSGCALIPAGMGSSVGPEPGRHVDPLDKDVTGKLDLPKSRASLEEFASCGGLQREGLALHTSSWLAVRLVYPYMLAAFVPPLVTAIILPLVLSPQVRQSSVLGDWSIQLTVLANQLGNVTGSALLPIPRLRRPRATLLAAALAMLPFVGAFVVVLKLQAGPAVVIPISYVMYLASGYLTTTVFGIAPGGLRAADAELVQALLVLTTAASFVLGSGVAWSWLAAKPAC